MFADTLTGMFVMSPHGVVGERCMLRAVDLGGMLFDSGGAESCHDFRFPDTI